MLAEQILSYIGKESFQQLISLLKDSKDFTNLISEKIDYIDRKLDKLIKSSYREAIMYYREGNRVKFREKIIASIAKDSHNLPAKLMYINLMIEEERYDIAIEQYWELIDVFGYINKIVPDLIRNKHFEISLNKIHLKEKIVFYPGSINCVSYYDQFEIPKEIWISSSLVCIKWNKRRNALVVPGNCSIVLYNLKKSKCVAWKVAKGDIKIANLSNKYLYLNIEGEKIIVDSCGCCLSANYVDYSIFNRISYCNMLQFKNIQYITRKDYKEMRKSFHTIKKVEDFFLGPLCFTIKKEFHSEKSVLAATQGLSSSEHFVCYSISMK